MKSAIAGLLGIGVAASVSGAVCPNGANLLANCGFESDASGWTLPIGDLIQRTVADSHSGGASGEMFADDTGTVLARSACMTVTPNTAYVFGAYFKHDAGQPPATCKVQLRQNSNAVGACSAFVSVSDTPLFPVNDVDWTLADRAITTAANALSAWLDISCIGGDALTTIRIDDVYLGVGLVAPLFADGFEANGTGEWSAVGP